MIKKVFTAFVILKCSFAYSQNVTTIHASITTNTKELGIKYVEAEHILKNATPKHQFLFISNSVMIKIYEIDDRFITLFIDADGKMIAWHSQKTSL